MVSSEPSAAYPTAMPNSSRLIVQSTPANATTVSVPFRKIRVNERVVAVNAFTSSAMRWSGLSTAPVSLSQ